MHTLEQLHAFIAVFEQKSYSAAGRKLNKDRTTIRELVKSYEDNLGFSLFEIQGRKAHPTPYATELVKQAYLVLRQNSKLTEYSKSIYTTPKSIINIGYDADFPFEFIAELERRLHGKYPHLTVHWRKTTRLKGVPLIAKGTLDFAILPTRNRVEPEYPLQFTLLGYISYGLYVGKHSRLANKTVFTLEDGQFETQYLSENAWEADGIIKEFSSQTRQVSSNRLIVHLLQNDGWAILPNDYANDEVNKVKLTKLESNILANDVKIGFGYFHQIGQEQSSTIQHIKKWCDELAKTFFQSAE
ncbi:LysR family transcriptional regulator [Vibrio lamellibrachiae]|uniref:LysR family transcriptional regulator n=1 Tax=Vibrio lamellibrachiae TaxID=2910253 RepID=UPI003D0EC9F5